MKFEFGSFDEEDKIKKPRKEYKKYEERERKYPVISEYKITKEKLLKKLGFQNANVTFISYDYIKGILTIKTK